MPTMPFQRSRARLLFLQAVTITVIGAMTADAAEDAPGPVPADLIIVNGRVWTGVPQAPEAEAVAIRGDRIVALGLNDAIRAYAGDQTRVLDVSGRRVIPGITDSHTHFIGGGLALLRINLRDVVSREEFRDRIAAAVTRLTPGAWLLGGRWSVESWDKPETPNRTWLDDLTPGTPVFLERMDGHQALVNTVALRYARIDADGPADPPGGEIVRDPKTGNPTGILKDSAMSLVASRIPAPKREEERRALGLAMDQANRFGITGIHDMSVPDELDVFADAGGAGALTVRVTVYLSVEQWNDNIEKVKRFALDDPWLRVAGFKGFMDGSLGSRNAYMREPFRDAAPDAKYPRGMLAAMADPPQKLAENITRADAAGLQPAIHAIGDEANHILLDTYESLARENGPRARRPRIEHAQHLLRDDIARFGKLGVIASMQPYHKADDGRYAESALGPERCATSYAFRSLLDTGAALCFGSDWPVVTINPFAGMATAVGAKTLDGRVWYPEQSITPEQALTAYTVTPAYAAHRETELGTIEVGKLADIAVLSQDVLQVGPERMPVTTATHTIVGGRLVWSAKPES